MSAPARLRDYLLPATLEYAARNTAFYADHLGDAWHDVRGVADLHRLPVLRKERAVEHQQAMRCGEAAADFGAVSSGTTRVGRELFQVQHCPEENEALAEYHAMIAEAARTRGEEAAEPPLVLQILTPNHGLPAAMAPANTLRLAWSYSANICQMVEQALRNQHGGRRITVMRCSTSILKQLTVWFLDRDVDFGDFALEAIGTNAARVTPRWRRTFDATWGARIYDNYSISEIVTPATDCDACGWHHFTAPPLIYEVIDPVSGEPLDEGVGELLLTGLYPYVQRQPLIRYGSGDLVELGPMCDAAVDRGVRFVGRVKQTAWREVDGRAEYLLFPTAIEDAVDELSEVACHEHPFETVLGLPHGRVGHPLFRSDHEADRLTVTVAVRFDPLLFSERAAELSAALRATLLDRHPALQRAVEAESIAFHVELATDAARDDWFVKYLM